MKIRLALILLSGCILQGCAAPVKPYAFHPEPFSKMLHSKVVGDLGSGNGLIVILKIDGQDTKTHPDIPQEVRMHDKNLFLPNAVTVKAGKHQLGVGYVFTDVSGKLATSKMAKAYEQSYLPKEKREYITVWHYEEFEINAKSGMIYHIGREFDTKTERARITVSECSEEKQCKSVEIFPMNARDNAYSGWANPDVLNEMRK